MEDVQMFDVRGAVLTVNFALAYDTGGAYWRYGYFDRLVDEVCPRIEESLEVREAWERYKLARDVEAALLAAEGPGDERVVYRPPECEQLVSWRKGRGKKRRKGEVNG